MRRPLLLSSVASILLVTAWSGCSDDDGDGGGGTGGTETGTTTGTGTPTATTTGTGSPTGQGSGVDYLMVTVDGNEVFSVDRTSPLCGGDSYTLQTVDLSEYADGETHDITFVSETFAANGDLSSFMVDLVSLQACGSGGDGGAGGGMASGGAGGGMASGGAGGGMASGGAGGGAPTSCEVIADGSFEGGDQSDAWTQSSTGFVTPLCDSSCANGNTLAHDGEWWAWFGGVADYERGELSQTVTIPADTATLTFYLQVPTCDDGGG